MRPIVASCLETYSKIMAKVKVEYITEFGMPELDRIIQGQQIQFRKTNLYTRIDVVEEDKNTIPDRISELPDDILSIIISFLTMREGAITSILARRWRNLWSSSSVSCLDFNHANIFGYEYSFQCEQRRKLSAERAKFISRVNRLLRARRASMLDALRISFVLYKKSASHIDRWIMSAVTQGITQLTLDLLPLNTICNDPNQSYTFPYWIFLQEFDSSLKHLSLNFCIFSLPPDFKGLKSLISLTLRNIYLTQSDVQNILSNCSSLEWLSLEDAKFRDPTPIVKFSCPSLLLKHLHLDLIWRAIDHIEVHDANISSFELRTRSSTKVSIRNTPHLARLVLHECMPTVILDNVPCIETLIRSESDWDFSYGSLWPKLYVFNNIKRFVFLADRDTITNLDELTLFLEACHLLQKLEVEICYRVWYKHTEKITERPDSVHYFLKEVEIYGFQRHPNEMMLARYLLKNASSLEKMKISTTSKSYHGNGLWCNERASKLSKESLEEVRVLLQEEVTELSLAGLNSTYCN